MGLLDQFILRAAHVHGRGGARSFWSATGSILFLPFILCLLHTGAVSAAPPMLEFTVESPADANEGHITLQWHPKDSNQNLEGWRFELQQSSSSDFAEGKAIYSGADRSSFISGLPSGGTWFRVRGVPPGEVSPTPWSKPLRVQVEYPSRQEVYTLLTVGAIVFVSTVAAILIGHRRHGQGLRTSPPDHG